ncbi:MAG TPA: class I SAM-dependent methyltransferase [Vicinamibacterales bacterium]|nr:class I SAM-dependent methyltransferase [Vicinamibacterales bacterium]
MSNGAHVDRRFDQTQHEYAADDLEIIEEAHRYGEYVFGLFKPFIGLRVLEVGAGIGTMSRKLVHTSDLVIGVEPNANCVARLGPAMSAEPKFTMLPCHLEECDLGELRLKQLDTVYCVNVLEHIEDDVAALKMFRDVIVPGGHVLIYVPAIQAAYGPLDAELGHHRRYSKRTLSSAFAAAGLDVISLKYANLIGLIGWMYNSHVTKTRHHSIGQVKLFERFVAPWALPLERMIPPPVGSSLVAVGKKR